MQQFTSTTILTILSIGLSASIYTNSAQASSLDKRALLKVVQPLGKSIAACVAKKSQSIPPDNKSRNAFADHTFVGDISVRWTIHLDGSVDNIQISKSSVTNPCVMQYVTPCVMQEMAKVKFADFVSASQSSITITYPFRFRP